MWQKVFTSLKDLRQYGLFMLTFTWSILDWILRLKWYAWENLYSIYFFYLYISMNFIWLISLFAYSHIYHNNSNEKKLSQYRDLDSTYRSADDHSDFSSKYWGIWVFFMQFWDFWCIKFWPAAIFVKCASLWSKHEQEVVVWKKKQTKFI